MPMIIWMDNFNRETVSERVLARDVPDYWAEKIRDALRDKYSTESGEDWFETRPDDYKPYQYNPQT